MKTKHLSLLLILTNCSLFNISFGQLRVTNSGRVAIGSTSVPNWTKSYFNGEELCALRLKVNHIDPYSWASICEVNHSTVKSWIVDLNGSHNFYVLGNGTVFSTAGYVTSDSNLKTEISPIENPLAKLNALQGVAFKYKPFIGNSKVSDTIMNRQHFGFIAQDVEQVIPNIVATNDQQLKSVAYQEIIPILVETVKLQNESIVALNSRIEDLESIIYSIQNIDTSTGIRIATNSNIKVIPNPNNGSFDVIFENYNFSGPCTLLITNLQGSAILETVLNIENKRATFSDKTLSNGIYECVILKDAVIVGSQKIIIQK